MEQFNQSLDFDDIFDLWEPAWWESPWFWIAVVVCLLVCLFVLYYFVVWFCSRTKILSPGEQAIMRMKKIPAVESIVTQEGFKQLYVELLLVVKEYYEKQYGYKIIGRTDSELLEYARLKHGSTIFCLLIERLVDSGFVVKFAQKNMQQEQALEDYSFVVETILSDSSRVQKT